MQSDFVAYGLPEGDTEFVEYVNVFLADLRAANAIEALFDKYVEELLEPIIIEE